MLKVIVVKPPSIAACTSESYNADLLIEYPIDVKGDDEKMIEYGNEMISMWTLEVQCLQEKKETKEVDGGKLENKESETGKDGKLKRQQTEVMADKLKATMKSEVTKQRKKNNELIENSQTGIIRPALMSKRFNINKTIATKLFGDHSLFKPNVTVFLFLNFLFIVTTTIAILAAWHFIPSNFVYFCIGGWPFLFYSYLIGYNIDIAKQLFRQPQTIIYYMWCFVFYISMLIEYRTQEDYAGFAMLWSIFLFSSLGVPLFDSITNFDIRMISNKLLMPGCNILICLHQVAMFFNWPQIPESNSIQLFGHINMSISALGFSSLSNVIILIGINIISAYLHPHSLIVIKSRVEAVIMSEEEAVTIRAMDQIGNETAEANKQQDIIEVITGKMMNKFSSAEFTTENKTSKK